MLVNTRFLDRHVDYLLLVDLIKQQVQVELRQPVEERKWGAVLELGQQEVFHFDVRERHAIGDAQSIVK